MLQFITELRQGLADCREETRGGVFHLFPDVGVAQRITQRVNYRLGGGPNGAECLSDIVLVRSVFPDQLVVAVAEFSAERIELRTGLLPGINRFFCSRIVFVRIHLLDGTYELFRAYYGVPARTAPDGREVGAIRGLVETTLSLLRESGVSHVAVATDTVITSFRNEMFDGYKTGEGIEPALVGQFLLADQMFSALGLVVWDMIEFEADDALAAAANRWVGDVEEVVILSPDKDMMQCVRPGVVTYDRRNRKQYGFEQVVEKFGVEPESIPDYLALVGDTADGVPGLPGWGAKSASVLLYEYKHIESIPTSESDWAVAPRSAAKLAATLAERMDDALLYRDLTTLRLDVPLPQTLDDLEWKGVRRTEFLSLCDQLGLPDETRNRPHRWTD